MRTLSAHSRSGTHSVAAWAYGCYVWSLFALFVLIFGGSAMLLRRPPQGRRIARLGARMLLRLAGIPVAAQGLARLPMCPHVLLVNHGSFLDAIVLTALLPAPPGYAYTTRQEFRIQRLLCPLLRSLGTLAMLPPEARHGKSNVDRMVAVLRRGESLVIFPEGAFSAEPGLKPFHSGAFVAAAKADVPIVVAGLHGTRTALPLGTWLPRRIAVTLQIGPVLMPHGSEPDAIAQSSDAAHKAMASLAGETDFIA
jgi:1-acyl-sn-glycerol-3-phosphate acyltransferase